MADAKLRLNELFLCKRRIRFLQWKPPDKAAIDRSSDADSIPLFLGADVLAECNILMPNLPRTHARFHKTGFSTKVSFPPSARVVGIQGSSRGVWFYSIQGLFRVVFEFYSREEQFDCLGTLSNLWKQRIADSPLNEEIVITLCETSARAKIPAVQLAGIPKHSKAISIETISKRVSDSVDMTEMSIVDIPATLSDGQTQKKCMSEPKTKMKELVSELTDLFLKSKGIIKYDTDNMDLVEHLTDIVKEYKSTLTCDFLKVAPVNEKRALCVISRWLGRVFYNFRDKVNKQVFEFKSKNLGNIHNLPSAECVIDELFSPLMKIFLLSWMNVGGSIDSQDRDSVREDIGPSSTSKLVLLKSPFPVIQLILELANQTLVSGVAHVLYSRLAQEESV